MDWFCLSHTGHPVVLDRQQQVFRCVPWDQADPQNLLLCAPLSSVQGPVSVRDDAGIPHALAGYHTVVARHASAAMSGHLLADARFGCARRPGDVVTFDRDEPHAWETFIFAPCDWFEALRSRLSGRLLSIDRHELLTIETSIDAGQLRTGNARFDLVTNLEAFAQFDRALVLRQEGYRFSMFRRYRPLVYFACSGEPPAFELLRESLRSLTRTGRYDGDICIITDRIELAAGLAADFPNPITVLSVELPDSDDYYFARYRIFDLPDFETYTAVIYVDTDVIFQDDVHILLRRICLSHGICVGSEEYEDIIVVPVSLIDVAPSLGSHLFAGDPFRTGYRYGFNSGIIGFAPSPAVEQAFRLVLETKERLLADGRRELDQPVANYVFRKCELVDFTTISGYVAVGAKDAIHYHARPAERCVIVHFWRVAAAERHAVMQRVNAYLAARHALDADLALPIFSPPARR